jgi:hypothetical protein
MDMLGTQKRQFFTYCLIGIIGFALILIGCQSFKRESGLMKKWDQRGKTKIKMSAQELRLQLNDMVGVFNGSIEQSASLVLQEAKDPAIRRQALLWKINAIPTVDQSLFQRDPLIAFIDAWAFSLQMTNYFESGPGKSAIGAWREYALEASKSLEQKMADLGSNIAPEADISNVREKLAAWAAEHPIEEGFIFRDTVVPDLHSTIGEKAMDAFQTVGVLTAEMNDLSFQLNIQMNLMPKQARWQAELMLEDIITQDQLESGLAAAELLGKTADRVAPVLEKGPEFLTEERQKVLDALRQERIATLEEIDRQRIAALAYATRERVAILKQLEQERLTATADLQQELALMRELVVSERNIILDNFNEQRTATIEEFNNTTDRMLAQTDQMLQGLMHRVFLFTAVLMLGGVVLVIFLIRIVLLNRPSGN